MRPQGEGNKVKRSSAINPEPAISLPDLWYLFPYIILRERGLVLLVVMAHSNATLCLPRPSSGLNTKVPAIVTSELPSAALPPNHVLIRVERYRFSSKINTFQLPTRPS